MRIQDIERLQDRDQALAEAIRHLADQHTQQDLLSSIYAARQDAARCRLMAALSTLEDLGSAEHMQSIGLGSGCLYEICLARQALRHAADSWLTRPMIKRV